MKHVQGAKVSTKLSGHRLGLVKSFRREALLTLSGIAAFMNRNAPEPRQPSLSLIIIFGGFSAAVSA